MYLSNCNLTPPLRICTSTAVNFRFDDTLVLGVPGHHVVHCKPRKLNRPTYIHESALGVDRGGVCSMPSTRKSITLLGVLALVATSLQPSEPTHRSAHSHAEAGAGHKPVKSNGSMTLMPMPLVAPLFISNAEFTSALGLENAAGMPAYADIILRAPDGTQVAQRRLSFAPHSVQQVDIAEMLKSSGTVVTMGSIVVMPSAELTGPAFLASLSITYLNSSEANFIDEKLAMPSSTDSQLLRGVADKSDGSPLIAVASLATAAQHVTIQCLGPNGLKFSKTVNLAPGQSIFAEACSSQTLSGTDLLAASPDSEEAPRHATGIALTSDAMPGSFAAFGLAPHRKSNAKFFSSIPFIDPEMAMSPNSVFTGVLVGPTTVLGGENFVPELSLANFSDKLAHVTVQYAETSGETSAANDVLSVSVPPGQTRQVVLDNLQGNPDLTNSFLVLSDGAPGDLVAKLVSKSPSTLGEAELLAKDQLDPDNMGIHPWTTEGGTESTLLLFDHSGAPQTFAVHLFSGGTLWQKNYKLKSMETMEININTLIANKIQDDTGKTIPPGSTSGVVSWMLGGRGVGKGRLLQSNASTGMARSFSCEEVTTVSGATWTPDTTMVPDATTVDINGPTGIIDLVNAGSCSGTYETTGNAETWIFSYSSGNTSIATATLAGGGSVNVRGISIGTATIYGEIEDPSTGCSATAEASPSVVPDVTFTSFSPNPIPTSSAYAVVGITVMPAATIVLTIVRSGTGSATFPNHNATLDISESTSVDIVPGTVTQSTIPDLTLEASYQGAMLASVPFSVTSGACTSTNTGGSAGGLRSCPSQQTLYQTYSVVSYCPSCQFSCIPIDYDSTFTPTSCTSVITGLTGAPSQGETSTALGTFSYKDCNFHNLNIQTTIVNALGQRTLSNGGSIGLQCTTMPNGTACP
jgi:hypothetical protein